MSIVEKTPGENSLEKSTIEQLPHVTSNKTSVKFHQSDDFSDKSKVIKSAEFAGEVIELVELSIGWRPWHYQVNVKQGKLYHTMANFRTLGDAQRLWESWTGKDVK